MVPFPTKLEVPIHLVRWPELLKSLYVGYSWYLKSEIFLLISEYSIKI